MSHGFSIGTLIAVLVGLPLAVIAATNSDTQYQECEWNATNVRESRTIDRTWNYHIDWMNLLHERRARLFDAWGIYDDRGRTSVIRDVERDISNRLRDLDRNYKNDIRSIQTDFRNDDRRCRDELRGREQGRRNVPVGRVCTISDECAHPFGACTTEFGDCRHFCGPNESCQQVCQGNCVLR